MLKSIIQFNIPISEDELLTIGVEPAVHHFTCEASGPVQPAPSIITTEIRAGCFQWVDK